jgi:cobalt-zinc-cadmium efflux system outer membrane protein
VLLAKAKIAEAEAKVVSADVRSIENPTVSAAMDPRLGIAGDGDVDISIEIPFELGDKRAKRVSAARAGVIGEKHRAADAGREAVASAVRSYYLSLYAEERIKLAREQKRLAEEVLSLATARYEAGQIPQLEINLAEAEVSRAQSRISAEQVFANKARTTLSLALSLPSLANSPLGGELGDRKLLDTLIKNAPFESRPDLLAALADAKAAEEEIALAEAERRPDIAFNVNYGREENDGFIMAGVSISLPLFNPREGAVLEARARRESALIEARIKEAAVTAEIEGARESYRAAVEGVSQIEENSLPRGVENERLATESYRAGKTGLATLLQVRREASESRRDYLDTLLEAAEAGTELAFVLGCLTPVQNQNL